VQPLTPGLCSPQVGRCAVWSKAVRAAAGPAESDSE